MSRLRLWCHRPRRLADDEVILSSLSLPFVFFFSSFPSYLFPLEPPFLPGSLPFYMKVHELQVHLYLGTNFGQSSQSGSCRCGRCVAH